MRRPLSILALAALPAAAADEAALPAPVDPAGYAAHDPAMIALGRFLFYDPILSGNRGVSCATCHHPRFGTSDGVSLSIGDGGRGLGPERAADPENPPEELIPRNAPGLWNLGHADFTVMFHDGRLEADASRPSGLRTPLGPEMETGFASVLSAQSMFPVLSPDEMAGHYSENEISRAVRMGRITGDGGAWDLLTDRLEAIPEYRSAFTELFGPGEIAFTEVSDAIAAFVAEEWRADDSPFDRHLRGEADLPAEAASGMALFYGPAGCSDCHSGPFQTDHGFHATGLVQFGPGKRGRFEEHVRDEGRYRVTGDPADLFAFRTPSLRMVTETAPYGHDGAYPDLERFLRAHSAPRAAWGAYDAALARVPRIEGDDTFAPLTDPAMAEAVLAATTVPERPLAPEDIARLVAFLGALTDEGALAGRLGVPETVPSGLPVER